jgi:hypothetical protein
LPRRRNTCTSTCVLLIGITRGNIARYPGRSPVRGGLPPDQGGCPPDRCRAPFGPRKERSALTRPAPSTRVPPPSAAVGNITVGL